MTISVLKKTKKAKRQRLASKVKFSNCVSKLTLAKKPLTYERKLVLEMFAKRS